MGVQNALKKPAFSKTVRGYSTEEVDRYIAYVNERYSAVCRESAELKRRLTRLMLGLDSPAAEKNGVETGEKISQERLHTAIRELSEECRRHSDMLRQLLNSLAAEEPDCAARADASEDQPSEGVADGTDARADAVDKSPTDNTAGDVERLSVGTGTNDGHVANGIANNPPDTAAVNNAVCSSSEDEHRTAQTDTDIQLADEPAAAAPQSRPDTDEDISSAENTASATASESSEDFSEDNSGCADSEAEMTPAQRAAALDFYPIGEDHNGDFDPMTLAAEITSHKKRKPYGGIHTEE